jgi:hypothetical protein
MDMKSFFKRSAISMVVLGMAGTAFAGTHHNMNNNNAAWSPQVSGVFIGVEGLDLRPQNGDIDYVTVIPPVAAGTGGVYQTSAVSQSYNWGWRIFAGLNVTQNDDLTLSWMNLNSSNSSTTTPATGTNMNPRWVNPATTWTTAYGKVNFNLNDAYLVWGHTVNFNNPWSVRFAGGLEYARIRSNLTVTENSTAAALSPYGYVGFQSKSRTTGFGPRLEVDMTYHLPAGFAVFADGNAAMLVSTRDISMNPVNTTPVTPTFFYSDFTNRHIVVPKFGTRLGVAYSYVWGQVGAEGVPCRTTTLTVDAGWQAEAYIHAIERAEEGFTSLVVRSTESFAGTKVSNFSDQGLFIGVALGTDWM